MQEDEICYTLLVQSQVIMKYYRLLARTNIPAMELKNEESNIVSVSGSNLSCTDAGSSSDKILLNERIGRLVE